jgi:hypothetical protein
MSTVVTPASGSPTSMVSVVLPKLSATAAGSGVAVAKRMIAPDGGGSSSMMAKSMGPPTSL